MFYASKWNIYELEGIVSSSENVEQLMGNQDCDEECTRLLELSNQIMLLILCLNRCIDKYHTTLAVFIEFQYLYTTVVGLLQSYDSSNTLPTNYRFHLKHLVWLS